jgi:23S rRNA (cytosine1962-C5)-methyltransferase
MTAPQKITVSDKCAHRLRSGYPWVMRADLAKKRPKDPPPGAIVDFTGADGVFAGRGYFNPRAQIAGRVLTRKPDEAIDRAFLEGRVRRTLEFRTEPSPFYRLIHAESGGFPGLIVDRYGDVLVAQVNTAGMQRLFPVLQEIFIEIFRPKAIVLRNDTPGREKEGLKREVKAAHGALPAEPFVMSENGAAFYVDVVKGQKTGWFFDQRENRAAVAELAAGKTMIDVFCHTGGFGVAAAVRGATKVTFVDSSAKALADARANAALNGVEGKSLFVEGKAFEVLERLAQDGKTYDVVSLDPPAFIKSRDETGAGLRGYRKLAKLAAPLVAKGGHMFLASCSHHASQKDLLENAAGGIASAGRKAELIRTAGAAADHPVHPMLAETGYLKALTFRFLD